MSHAPFIKSLFLVTLLALWLFPGGVMAEEESVEELQQQIEEKSKEIRALEETAEQYRQTIATTEEEAKTLAAEVKRVNQAIAKLQNDIQLTTKKIQRASLEVKSLATEISKVESDIETRRRHLAEMIRELSITDRDQPLIVLLRDNTLSSFFNRVEALTTLHQEISRIVSELHTFRAQLTGKKTASEDKVRELQRYNVQLSDKRKLQQIQQTEKNRVLTETRSREQAYRELLAENEKRRKALEEEILEFENQLQATIDPTSLPRKISGVLLWPLPTASRSLNQCGYSVWAFLTQCFGLTEFARAGGYSGKGHNGIDLRAESGTEIYAAEDGVVRGTGDTDAACRKASYGRWILVDHTNNLATLYAHLSLIKVSAGQRVSRGDLIGYSGQTGYATGPHLHFSVFAKGAVEVGQLRSRVCGRVMTLPLSAFNGYLNPLDYL
ncbi:MAG: peptidoglycan DD-metalloendopeptidase family protein [Candidatus Sungbacteria bacterium]|nr:peptidoglycan DD-metalloendopeptidase family protein [Candidatus Sungbacteria bacterium]